MLATSLPLSAAQKTSIKTLLSPFVLSENDVFGQEDLNKYLSKYPEIEKAYFKLWLSSSTVLHTILNNGIEGRSNFAKESIKKNISLYVKTKNYPDAFEILEVYNYLLVTGQPGVGKTTLAKLLSYDLMSKGFCLIYIDDDLSEAERVFNPDPEVRQLFYFDDFLGANYLEIINPKTTESRLVHFLERIKNAKNKLLILTTRTTVYQTALSRYEKLARTRTDIVRNEISLGDYSDYDKALILYNHLYHSDIPAEFTEAVRADKNYLRIIQHRNYTPRLIEFFTRKENVSHLSGGEYLDFIFANLQNPHEVWRYAYEQQLAVEDRLLLLAVFSVTGSTLQNVQLVFETLLQARIRNSGYQVPENPFKKSCRKLFDGLLKNERAAWSSESELDFANPSLKDFLINYLLEHEEEKWFLFSNSQWFEQLETYLQTLFAVRRTTNVLQEHNRIARYLLAQKEDLYTFLRPKSYHNLSARKFKLYAILNKLHASGEVAGKIDARISVFLSAVNFKEFSQYSRADLVAIVTGYIEGGEVEVWVRNNWDSLMEVLISSAVDSDDIGDVKEMCEQYDVDYSAFLKTGDFRAMIREVLDEYADERTRDVIDEKIPSLQEERDIQKLRESIDEVRWEIYGPYEIADYFSADSFLRGEKLEERMEENRENADVEYDDWKENRGILGSSKHDDTAAIDDLFKPT